MPSRLEDEALVVDFLNTVDIDVVGDVLATGPEFDAWSRSRGLRPGSRRVALELRHALRTLVVKGHATLPPVALSVRIDADGAPVLAGEDVSSGVLGAVVRLANRGDWERVKLCPNHVCLEAFYDRSKNRSRTWCDMRGCGSAAKSRAYRSRRRDTKEGAPVMPVLSSGVPS